MCTIVPHKKIILLYSVISYAYWPTANGMYPRAPSLAQAQFTLSEDVVPYKLGRPNDAPTVMGIFTFWA